MSARERLHRWLAGLPSSDLAIAAALALAVAWAYRAAAGFDFIQFDDTVYVFEHPVVPAGLTRGGIAWALTSFHTGNWIPLTWISHMLDVELFGLDPGSHHVVNAALHALNTALLFGVLRAATGARWPAAFAAAGFALHPAHVESVAWISQRKELLATACALLATAAYVGWVRTARPGRRAAALGLYAVGLACKPSVVVLPFLFLLLDVWPLGRTHLAVPAAEPPRAPGGTRQITVEKLPFFAIAALSSAIAFLAQSSAGGVRDLDLYPLGLRVATALVAYLAYFASAVWPADLSVFYPHPRGFPAAQIAAGAAFVLAGCAAALALARRLPAVAMGWFWFLGWLVPVIGLVQIGGQWRADRYTYFAFVGLFVAAAWSAAALAARLPRARPVLAVAAAGVIVAWEIASERQIEHWRNTRTLFEHALAVDPRNAMAHASLGRFAEREGRFADALAHNAEALRLYPDFPMVRFEQGRLLFDLGRTEEARAELLLAVKEWPNHPPIRFALARAHERLGQRSEALVQYREGLALQPDNIDARRRMNALALASPDAPR